jgi:hypothetical protein
VAYIPKNKVEQEQIDAQNNRAVLQSGMPVTDLGGLTTPGQAGAGTVNTAGSSALAQSQGGGGSLGNQFVNFQDLVEANKGATANQADAISQTIGVTDAQKSIDEALSRGQSAAQSGISNIDEDFLNQYLTDPFSNIDNSKYSNLSSILSGTGYKGPNTTADFYQDARAKAANAKTAAGLLDDPYGLQTMLAKNPTSGTTSGGIALDASLLTGNENARAKFGEVKQRAEDLGSKLATSQNLSDQAVQQAKQQQQNIQQTGRGRVLGTQADIRRQADEAITQRKIADENRYQQAVSAADTGNFLALKGILPDETIAALQGAYSQLDQGTSVPLSSYISGPTSRTLGYTSGDVLDKRQQDRYGEYSKILNNSDDYLRAGTGAGAINADRDAMLANLNSIYGNQQWAREQIAAALAAQKAAEEQARIQQEQAAAQAAEQARQEQLAREEQARQEAAQIAAEEANVSGGGGGSGSGGGGFIGGGYSGGYDFGGDAGGDTGSDSGGDTGGFTMNDITGSQITVNPDGSVTSNASISDWASAIVSAVTAAGGGPIAIAKALKDAYELYKNTNVEIQSKAETERLARQEEAARQRELEKEPVVPVPQEDFSLPPEPVYEEIEPVPQEPVYDTSTPVYNEPVYNEVEPIPQEDFSLPPEPAYEVPESLPQDSVYDDYYEEPTGGDGEYTDYNDYGDSGGSDWGDWGGDGLGGVWRNGKMVDNGFEDYLSDYDMGYANGGRVDARRGGKITGPGGPRTDSIPAKLSNGEYVIPAHIVRKLGTDFFDKLLEKNPLNKNR